MAANRFAFQISWVLCRILDTHRGSSEYAFILDYWDDVVQLDKESGPSEVKFFQIKSATKANWTVNRLLKREKGKDGPLPSILGKLFRHWVSFPNFVTFARFVSNRPFNAKLNDGNKAFEKTEVALSDCDQHVCAKIKSALKSETGETVSDDHLKSLFFERTVLTHDDHENQARGRLANFVELNLGPAVPSTPVYKTLRSELERRNNFEKQPASFEEVLKHKAFTRQNMVAIIGLAENDSSASHVVNSIQSLLIADGTPSARVLRLVASVRKCFAMRTDVTNRVHMEMVDVVGNSVASVMSDEDENPSVSKCVSATRQQISTSLMTRFEQLYDPYYLDGMILLAIYERTQL